MAQPCAKVTRNDVERIIRRDFPEINIDIVIKKLELYKSDSDGFRVWAAILKIADCNFDKLDEIIAQANYDYRDILATAEYPMYSELVGFDDDNINKRKLNLIIKNDSKQYNNWFNKPF